jgi:hypothetical protein
MFIMISCSGEMVLFMNGKLQALRRPKFNGIGKKSASRAMRNDSMDFEVMEDLLKNTTQSVYYSIHGYPHMFCSKTFKRLHIDVWKYGDVTFLFSE